MTGSGVDPGDVERFARYADELLVAVEAALPGWVRRSILSRLPAGSLPDGVPSDELERRVERAALAARNDVTPRLRDLLARDLDDQWTNPLSILRTAVVHPTAVLAQLGAAPAPRDEMARRLDPDDRYDLGPATFADLSEQAHQAGIAWGAAKAHIHLRRHGHSASSAPGGTASSAPGSTASSPGSGGSRP